MRANRPEVGASLRIQEFRSIRGDDPGAEGLSQEDQDSLDLTKLLSALQTGQFAYDQIAHAGKVHCC
jgi:hypothetical protein